MAKRKVAAVSAVMATATMFGAEPASAQDALVEANADIDANVDLAGVGSVDVDANLSVGIGGGADAAAGADVGASGEADAGLGAGADAGVDAGLDAGVDAGAGAGLDASVSADASFSAGGFAPGAEVTFTLDDGTVVGSAVADPSGVATLTSPGPISGSVTASGVDKSGSPVTKSANVTTMARAARAQSAPPRYAG